MYDRIYRPDILWRAWKEVKKNKGSAGIDGIVFEMIEEFGVEEYLQEINKELVSGTYKPLPVKRVYISKKAYQQLQTIMNKLKLTLNPEKTKIVDMNKDGFDFLGFHYQKFRSQKSGRMLPYMMPCKKSLKKVKDAIRTITCRKSAYEGEDYRKAVRERTSCTV